jgi:hypothetical protein
VSGPKPVSQATPDQVAAISGFLLDLAAHSLHGDWRKVGRCVYCACRARLYQGTVPGDRELEELRELARGERAKELDELRELAQGEGQDGGTS